MKKFVSLAVLLSVLVAFAACQRTGRPSAGVKEPTAKEVPAYDYELNVNRPPAGK